VDKVPYITAPGTTVRTVVSDLGAYEEEDGDGALRLTGVFGNRPEAEAVQAARAACGWDLAVASRLRRFEAPKADELGLMRVFDLRRYFLGDAYASIFPSPLRGEGRSSSRDARLERRGEG
jgi:hypothetical protein